jgi:hypothetical protein
MKRTLILIAYGLALFAGGPFSVLAQAADHGGPLPIAPYGYVQANPTIASFNTGYTAPTIGAGCYNTVQVYFDFPTNTLYGCVTSPGVFSSSTATWQAVAGSRGLTPGISTVASATTIAPTTQFVTLSGTTSIVTITPPATVVLGTRLTLICTGACAIAATGNVAAAVTGVAGAAYDLVWSTADTKWHPVL